MTLFARTLLEQVRTLPGITDASLSWDVPFTDMWIQQSVQIEGVETDAARIRRHIVAPGYFRTLGVPLLEGRDVSFDDANSDGMRIAVISRRLAQRYWPDGGALGKRLRLGPRTYEIVGVVGDAQHVDLLEPETADPGVYLSLFELRPRTFAIVARTSGNPQPVITAIRRTVNRLSSAIPIPDVRTGDQLYGAQVSRQRFAGALLATFTILALTLTIIGVYGVTAYGVSRQRQVGIRVALGATRGDVLRVVLAGGLPFIATGLIIGVLAAFALTRLLSSLLYGITATDLATFGTATALLAVVAVLACVIPATRATRIDPMIALRAE
ncbi:MAG: ABC transporter permease [Longimicrobiales bacterium]